MELKFICTFWGEENTSGEDFIKKVVDAGYDGAEINMPDDKDFESSVLEGIEKHNLTFIGQQWLPPKDESVEEYLTRFKNRLEYLIRLNPVFINSHSGKDFFSFKDNSLILEEAFKLEEKSGIKIVHETHRGRLNFSSFSTLEYLQKYENLKLNADFSHWCNVSESFLEDQTEALNAAIENSHYIHARVGHTQSAQVNDPFAPEWKDAFDIYVGWWKQILKEAETRGEKVFYICPEFGPYPYMPYLPYTFMPVQSQWDINVKMMNFLREELKS